MKMEGYGEDYDYENHFPNNNRKITSTRNDIKLCNNSVQTSKYTAFNFIFKNLFE